jgi:hypothetical protein
MKLIVAITLQLIISSAPVALSHPLVQKEGRFSVAGLDDDREVEQFFISFKEAIARADKKTVASLVSYPIRVNLASGRWRTIRTVADFIAIYDHIFDAKFKRLIRRTDVKDLWAKWSGVAMPRGELWFNGIIKDAKRPKNYTIKITAISGPIRS